MTSDDSGFVKIEEPRSPVERIDSFVAEAETMDDVAVSLDDGTVTTSVVAAEDAVSTSLTPILETASRYALVPVRGHYGSDVTQLFFQPVENVWQ